MAARARARAGQRSAGGVQPAGGDIPSQSSGRLEQTQIGEFYNGRDHSTVCYAIARVRVLRETDPEVHGLVTVLTNELRDRAPSERKPGTQQPDTLFASRMAGPLVDEDLLDALAERIASRLLSKLTAPHYSATASAADVGERLAEALAASRG